LDSEKPFASAKELTPEEKRGSALKRGLKRESEKKSGLELALESVRQLAEALGPVSTTILAWESESVRQSEKRQARKQGWG
jgi:hypothetical protein